MKHIHPDCHAGIDCEGCSETVYCPQRDPKPILLSSPLTNEDLAVMNRLHRRWTDKGSHRFSKYLAFDRKDAALMRAMSDTPMDHSSIDNRARAFIGIPLPTTFRAVIDGSGDNAHEFEAVDITHAKEIAREWIESGTWGPEEDTLKVWVWSVDSRATDIDYVMVRVGGAQT